MSGGPMSPQAGIVCVFDTVFPVKRRGQGKVGVVVVDILGRRAAAWSRITVGSSCQQGQDLALLPLPLPPAVQQQRAQRR